MILVIILIIEACVSSITVTFTIFGTEIHFSLLLPCSRVLKKYIIKQLTCIKSADCRHFRYWLFTFCRNYRNIYTLMLEHDNVSDTSMKYLYQSIHVHNLLLKSHFYDCLLSLISPVFIFKELLCWCGCMLVNTDIPNS